MARLDERGFFIYLERLFDDEVYYSVSAVNIAEYLVIYNMSIIVLPFWISFHDIYNYASVCTRVMHIQDLYRFMTIKYPGYLLFTSSY